MTILGVFTSAQPVMSDALYTTYKYVIASMIEKNIGIQSGHHVASNDDTCGE